MYVLKKKKKRIVHVIMANKECFYEIFIFFYLSVALFFWDRFYIGVYDILCPELAGI